MKIDVLSLFPEMFEGFLTTSIIKRAIDSGHVEVNIHDFREFATDRHKSVDDTPYGGGAGMLMRVDVLADAIRANRNEDTYVLLTSPKAKPYKEQDAYRLLEKEDLMIVCGHYEGVDDRISDFIDENVSIGDYVLTGGEIPAMVLIDSVSRYVDGVLSDGSTSEESFSQGILEYPQYTRPETFEGVKVPEILQSGHHENINKWRRYQALKNTYYKRPELLENVELSEKDKEYLDEIKSKKDIK